MFQGFNDLETFEAFGTFETCFFLRTVSGETAQHRGNLHTCVFQALIPRLNPAPIRCPGPSARWRRGAAAYLIAACLNSKE